MQIDVRPDHLEIIKNALKLHVPDRKVVAFGSRVKWTARDTSDLDLCVMGDDKISFETLAALRNELSDSNLPYKVDVIDWASIAPDFRKIVSAQCYEIKSAEDKGWSYKRLSDAALINPPVKLAKDNVYPFVDMAAIEVGRKFVEPSEQRPYSGGGSKFAHGDTLLARITPCLENGKIAMFRGGAEHEVAHGSTEFIVFRGRPEVSDSQFIYYLVTSQEVRAFAIAQMTGSSGRQRVPTSAFDHITVGLPPLPEQKAIANLLQKLDDKIELNNKMNETLEATAQALFKSWFVDFEPVKAKMEGRKPEGLTAELAALFPDKLVDSPLGQIPQGWKVDEIGNLLEAIGGTTPSTTEPSYWEGGTLCWATPKDLSSISSHVLLDTERKVTEKGLLKISSGLLPAGTVLLSSRAPIGYLVVSEVPVAINQGFIAMKPKGIVGTQYILHWTIQNMESIKSRANGSTFQEISKKAFRPILALLPKKELLAEFEKTAGALHNRVVENLRQNQRLILTRDTLLPKLISGELRVGDAASRIKEAV